MVTLKVSFLRTRGFARLAIGLVVGLLLTAAPLLRGAIRFDVMAGYSGSAPQNAWYPLTCELQNTGPSVNAVIEIATDRLIQAPTRRLRLELPANTTKRVTIPVFTAIRYSGDTVRLLDERGKILAEPNFISSQGGVGRPVLGFLSRASAGVPSIPQAKSKNVEVQPLAVRLQAEFFPDNPLVLDGIPSMYLNSERAMNLTQPQYTALLAWIQHGGNLILGCEQIADLTSRDWIRSLLPFDPASTVTVDSHGQLQQWIREYTALSPNDTPLVQPQPTPPRVRNNRPNPNMRSQRVQPPAVEEAIDLAEDSSFESASLPIITGKLRDGKVLVGTDTSPIIIQAQRGRGKITVLTFSPEREPFISWKNRGWFWAKISNVPSKIYKSTEYIPSYGWNSTDGIFGSMVETKQVRKLPLTWLLMLLGVYLVVIGPLDQYVLKKAKRQMLTWITFPIYVIAFSGLIYFIGFYLRAGDLECNELNVVDILPNAELGRATPSADGSASSGADAAVLRGQTYCSIYSPLNNKYPLKGAQTFAALRGETRQNRGQNSRAEVMQQGNGFTADAFVAVWTSELFVSDWLQPGTNPLGLTVKAQGKDWLVTIDNQAGHPLKDVRIVLGQRIFSLGQLQPGKSTHTLPRESGRMLFEFVNSISSFLQSAASERLSNFQNQSRASIDIKDASVAASFPSFFSNQNSEWNSSSLNAPPGVDLSSYVNQGHAVLLAFDENRSLSAPLGQFKARRGHSDTLLRLVLPMPSTTAPTANQEN